MLKELYPNFTKTFEEYENILLEIAKNINRAYVDRFIRNLYVSVPQEEYGVIRSCHEWHINDRSRNKISLSKVIEVLNQQEATSLNKMIKRYYLEQKNKLNPQRNRQKINNETDFPELKRSA